MGWLLIGYAGPEQGASSDDLAPAGADFRQFHYPADVHFRFSHRPTFDNDSEYKNLNNKLFWKPRNVREAVQVSVKFRDSALSLAADAVVGERRESSCL